jgi:hypothetical protein
MKSNAKVFAVRASTLAVQGALALMSMVSLAAFAADEPTVEDLTVPKTTVDVGAIFVSDDSFKFGEYNGLAKKGLYLDLNIDAAGGGAWDSADPTRWSVFGTNLGLDNRSIKMEYGKQGQFRFLFGFDELRRYRSDTYQTPYAGTGTNTLTLPSNWMIPIVPKLGTGANARGLSGDVANSPGAVLTGGIFPAAGPTPPSAANLAASAAILASDLPDFHNFNLQTTRQAFDGGFVYNFTSQWEGKISARHEDKDGVKPMSTVTRQTGGDIATVIPDPIKQTTDQFNASLTYTADKGYLQAAYYGSLFHNDVKTVYWQNWADPTKPLNAMSSAPDNEFHQFLLTGGYNFDRNTKLVLNGQYSRSTQDENLYKDAGTPFVPVTTTNALIITKAFNARLTSRPMKDLNVSANYKYEDRDNQTPVNMYGFYDAQDAPSTTAANPAFTSALGLPAGALASNININANRPYGRKTNQANLDGDYRVAQGQNVKLGVDYQEIERSCDGTWIGCVDADKTKESTLRAEWRGNWAEPGITSRLAYAYSERKVDNYNEDAFLAVVPMANVVSSNGISAYQALVLSGLTGYGPIAGYNNGVFAGTGLTAAQAGAFFGASGSSVLNNALVNALYANGNRISELPGMRRYNMADRNRDKLRGTVNWQATERWGVQLGADVNKDKFDNSTYGLQSAKNYAINLDSTYAFTDDVTGSLFYTYEDQRSDAAGNSYTANSNGANLGGVTAVSGGCYGTVQARNNNAKIDPCLNWSVDMKDIINTLGLSVKDKSLMAGRLSLAGDVLYTYSKSDNSGFGGNYVTNPWAGVAGNPTSGIASYFIPAVGTPTSVAKVIEFRLSGRYFLDKFQSLRAGYLYQRMKSNDYAYDAMQFGGLAGVLPSNEQAFNYNVHVFGVGYTRSF